MVEEKAAVLFAHKRAVIKISVYKALAKAVEGTLKTGAISKAYYTLEPDPASEANNTVAMKFDDFEQSSEITKANDTVIPSQESNRAVVDKDLSIENTNAA